MIKRFQLTIYVNLTLKEQCYIGNSFIYIYIYAGRRYYQYKEENFFKLSFYC